MAIPRRYRAEHIKAGLVGYPERPDLGTLLVSQTALENMRKSFIGKPVVNLGHTDADPAALFDFTKDQMDEIAVGVVSDAGKLENGWEYVDMLIWDEETQRNIDQRGFSVSNAYKPTAEGGPGTENQIPYDAELVDGEYLHMAIVPNPRYQDAKVYANSIKEKRMGLKLFTKKAPKVVENAAMEEMDVENAMIKNGDEEIALADAIAAYKKQQETEQAPAMLNADDEVDVDGKKVKVSELMNAYKNMSEKPAENAEPLQTDEAEPVVDEQKQVQNSVNKTVKNSAQGVTDTPVIVETKEDRLAAGKARYSSTVAQGGNK
jgi:hypothetical protein